MLGNFNFALNAKQAHFVAFASAEISIQQLLCGVNAVAAAVAVKFANVCWTPATVGLL